LQYTELRVLLLRRTFPELEANHLQPLKMALKSETHKFKDGQTVLVEIAKYKAGAKTFEFLNGSTLKLGYCQYEDDANQYQGHEYDVICFEEATRFTESQMVFISSCLRSPRADFESRIYYTCNPGGPGHAYIKRLFINKEYEGLENPDDYSFVKALIYDNEIILKNDKNYIQLLNNMPEDLRRAHRDGDWDALAGQYFREFRKSIHAIEPFEIPDSWFWYISLDYGLDMFAVTFIAVDYEKNVYVTKEIHVPNLIISKAAELFKEYIAEMFNVRFFDDKKRDLEVFNLIENIKGIYAPPDLKARRQETGKSAFDLFYDSGIPLTCSSNNRVAGWYNIKEMLYFEYEDERNIEKGIKFEPIIHIFDNCNYLLKNLPLAQHDEKKYEDIATEPHSITHILDALRYFAIEWYKSPQYEKLPQIERGTMWREEELLMRGYSKKEINKMVADGHIRLNSFFGPGENSIDEFNRY